MLGSLINNQSINQSTVTAGVKVTVKVTAAILAEILGAVIHPTYHDKNKVVITNTVILSINDKHDLVDILLTT